MQQKLKSVMGNANQNQSKQEELQNSQGMSLE